MSEELKQRFTGYSLSVIRLYSALPRSVVCQVIGKQLLRSATSAGAHYHEAVRARSDAEFLSKIQVALQELEEARYWMTLLIESNEIASPPVVDEVSAETSELIAILVSSINKIKRRLGKQ